MKQINRPALKKVYPLLKLLERMSSTDRITIIQHLDSAACDAVYMCVYNGLHNTAISPQQRDALVKELGGKKRALRALMRTMQHSKVTDALKKKRLIQSGGGLGLILGTVLPLLASFLFK
jgi:hypothetical protein